MDSKFTVVLSAFESIKKFGWCSVGNSHKDEIKTIKSTIEQCGKNYSIIENEISTRIFVFVK
jgi:hypothetical protein